MYELVPVVADIMKDYYPYVCDKVELVQKVIKSEEDRFRQTLADGEKILTELMAKSETKTINGKDAFMLYDTYGFPYELTLEYAEESGFTVDKAGFDAEMEAQRERARNAREDVASMQSQNEALMNFKEESTFVGYTQLSTAGKVILLLKDGEVVDSLTGQGQVILDITPFYAESGGQVADTGLMTTTNATVEVLDVIKAPNGQHLHTVNVNGTLSLNDAVTSQVTVNARLALTKNHTATHLLHQALKDVIGEHANQAGSLVSAERLRFDFTNMQGLTHEELQRIETIVNEKIWASLAVETFEKTIDEAKEMGAMALFSEKYGDTVRVVKAG